jgi:hypothetical protein
MRPSERQSMSAAPGCRVCLTSTQRDDDARQLGDDALQHILSCVIAWRRTMHYKYDRGQRRKDGRYSLSTQIIQTRNLQCTFSAHFLSSLNDYVVDRLSSHLAFNFRPCLTPFGRLRSFLQGSQHTIGSLSMEATE